MAWYDQEQNNNNTQNGEQPVENGGWTNPTPSEPTTPPPSYTAPSEPTDSPQSYTAPSSDPNAPYTAPIPPRNPNSSYYPNPYAWQQSSPTPPPIVQPPKKGKGAKVAVAILVTVGVVVSVLFSVVAGRMLGGDSVQQTPSGNTSQTNPSKNERPAATLEIATADETAELLSVKSAIEANLDSTVNIVIYSKQTMGFGGFFGDYSSSESQLVQTGGATGIVMSKDGYIITNCHCVVNEETGQNYDRIDVEMYDGTKYENVEIIGADESTDLAVIKVDATDLKPATFGDSSKLELGDTVIVLGNPGGLGWTPSRGIISGSARDVYDSTGYGIKCLQTDAAINPGNSGGPLINLYGQVVGINSAKIVAEEYEGLGFSIPINEAKSIINDLIKNGYVTGRVSLGITGNTVKLLNYPGFQIETIESWSDLKNTNAKAGDIITHVNGVRVEDYATLRGELTKHNVGDTVKLTLIRMTNQRVETLEVTCKLVANAS